jgi:hypothetical protein
LPSEVAERIRGAVRDWIGGRSVVLAGMPVAATPRWIHQLRTLGAGRVLVVGTTRGTGELPDPEDAEWIDLDIRASDPVDEFRQFERVAADPPAAVTEALDRFDPQGDALLLAAPFQAVTALGGRAVIGGRRPEWVALEDKTTNDALFDRAGVVRPPCEVVAADDRGALGTAARPVRSRARHRLGGRRQRGLQRRRHLRALGDKRSAGGRRPALVRRPVPLGPGRALPGGNTLQHPRLRHRRRRRGVPPGGGDHAPVRGSADAALRGRRHLLRPARGRPGEDADHGPPGGLAAASARSASGAATRSTGF